MEAGEVISVSQPAAATVLVAATQAGAAEVLEAVVRELEAAGWRVAAPAGIPPDPWRLDDEGLVAVELLDGGRVAFDHYEDLARRGARQVLATASWELGCLLFDSLLRLGGALLVTPELVPVTWQLDAAQHGLLVAVAGGASVAEAAARVHLSERSAARRLAQARRRLGVPTTAAAAAVVGARLACVAPPATT